MIKDHIKLIYNHRDQNCQLITSLFEKYTIKENGKKDVLLGKEGSTFLPAHSSKVISYRERLRERIAYWYIAMDLFIEEILDNQELKARENFTIKKDLAMKEVGKTVDLREKGNRVIVMEIIIKAFFQMEKNMEKGFLNGKMD